MAGNVLHKNLTGDNLHQPFKTGTDVKKSTSPEVGNWYFAVDTKKLYRCVDAGFWESIIDDNAFGPTDLWSAKKIAAEISSTIEGYKGIEPLYEEDTSVTIEFDVPFLDVDYVVTLGLENTEDESPSVYAMIVTDKTKDGFTVLFSGEIDSDNYSLNWFAKA